MKKKFLALALTVAMVGGCLVGCGSSSNESATTAPKTEEATEEKADDAEGGEEAAPAADPIQNLIDATTDTVALRVWAAEEDQDVTKKMIDEFTAQYEAKGVKFNIELGVQSEANAKDTVLADMDAAADVFAFADDQIIELVNAGALQEVAQTYTYDVQNENLAGSVEAATQDGKLYAYPMTADNGYFLYYDKSVISEEEAGSMSAMCAAADKAGKKVAMIVGDAWYNYSFFKAAGLEVNLAADGKTNTCNWNDAAGLDVAQAIIDLGKTKGFANAKDDPAIVSGVKNGKYAAVVSGVWNSDAITKAWGDNIAATKLPTYTVAGEEKQMSSFSGYKMIGVNSHSKFVGWSMLLAEWLTNADNQKLRFQERGLGPANIQASESEEVQAAPAIAALAKQAEFAVPQRVGGNYWDPAKTLGQTLITGNKDGTDLQELLDNAVAGITAPVEG
ncbi:MAG TPA: maltose ABC transporter substrate-binding protein [Lachnospiraceae bacterium]|nr:maltose ABC transporter substrate-binding protein [Lachnospiraceae bacterium]